MYINSFFSFSQIFRLSKTAFVDLLSDLEPFLKPLKRCSSIPNVIKLASFLRFCAQGSYQSSVGNDFNLGLAQSTTSLVLQEIISTMEQHICPKWISLDYSREEKQQAKMFFYERSGIPGVIGAVDGTHIKIRGPEKRIHHLFYNRKGYYSLNAMIVINNFIGLNKIYFILLFFLDL